MPEDSFLGPHTFFGRLARYPLKLIPPSPILRGPVPGKKWIVGSKRHAFWLGLYEPEMQRRIVKVIRPGGIFYDIGANLGFYSLLASALVGQGRVFAFEPSPDNIAYLRRHVALNECADVEILELAVCDREGDGWFTLEASGFMGHLESKGKLQVRTTRLDALLQPQQIPAPNYIKMDIEGAEYLALLGVEECFRRHQSVLFLATHGKQIDSQCDELLHSSG
jgi:FkbM family methyltransferase